MQRLRHRLLPPTTELQSSLLLGGRRTVSSSSVRLSRRSEQSGTGHFRNGRFSSRFTTPPWGRTSPKCLWAVIPTEEARRIAAEEFSGDSFFEHPQAMDAFRNMTIMCRVSPREPIWTRLETTAKRPVSPVVYPVSYRFSGPTVEPRTIHTNVSPKEKSTYYINLPVPHLTNRHPRGDRRGSWLSSALEDGCSV